MVPSTNVHSISSKVWVMGWKLRKLAAWICYVVYWTCINIFYWPLRDSIHYASYSDWWHLSGKMTVRFYMRKYGLTKKWYYWDK